MVLFAGFFAPYGMETQNRTLYNCAPTGIHFRDASGGVHIRPFVYGKKLVDRRWTRYADDTAKVYPITIFAKGDPYTLLWFIPADRHLLGVDGGGRIFLWVRQFGRDVFSALYGGRISLAGGLVGISSFSLGMLWGDIGYFGGMWVTPHHAEYGAVMSVPAFTYPRPQGRVSGYIPSGQVVLALRDHPLVHQLGGCRASFAAGASLKDNDFSPRAGARFRAFASFVRTSSRSPLVRDRGGVHLHSGYILGEVRALVPRRGDRRSDRGWEKHAQAGPQASGALFVPCCSRGIRIFLTVLALNFSGDGLRDCVDRGRSCREKCTG